MIQNLTPFIDWANKNSGFVSIIIFTISVIFAWVTGIFRSLIKKPKFKIKIIPGPTLCCTFGTGKQFNDHDVHRTGISVYLSIANIGSAPASIEKVWVGYRWHLKPFSLLWLKFCCFKYWNKALTTTITDFQYDLGGDIKFYPSLFQANSIYGTKPDTYLEVGKSTTGMVYFEQDDSWGGFFPSIKNGKVWLTIAVVDTFGRKYKKSFYAPSVTLEEAQKFNPSFGATFAVLRKEIDTKTDI